MPAWLAWWSVAFRVLAVGCVAGCAGKHADAEQVHREVLEALRRVLGPDHPATLRSMNNLGTALQDQGKAGWPSGHEHAAALRLPLLVLLQGQRMIRHAAWRGGCGLGCHGGLLLIDC